MNKLHPKTLFTGKNTVYLPTCHSTNESAIEIIQKNDSAEGTIVITGNQTKGKGQRGNKWYSEPNKNLTFTLILKPTFIGATEQFKLNMAVSLAVFAALRPYLSNELKIKWPNDIFYRNEKLGGILIESIISKSVLGISLIGIGLNINQLDFAIPGATSLAKENENEEFELEEILESFCEQMEKEYLELKNGSDKDLKIRYIKQLYRFEEWHDYKDENGQFEAKIVGLSDQGKVIMETKFGLKQFGTKEFEYIYKK